MKNWPLAVEDGKPHDGDFANHAWTSPHFPPVPAKCGSMTDYEYSQYVRPELDAAQP